MLWVVFGVVVTLVMIDETWKEKDGKNEFGSKMGDFEGLHTSKQIFGCQKV